MEKIKWSKKVAHEVLEHIGENRTLVNNILRGKANWNSHTLRRNFLLHDAIEGQITEAKRVGRSRTEQLFDDLRNRRRYWGAKGDNNNNNNNNNNNKQKKKKKIIIPYFSIM